jgi:site-specific DNA-methyltransferase (adenine-specific)
MTHKITNANIKEWAANYDGELFDGILCDPPYELGFMGKSWDSSGIAFDADMWADILKLLKPGGHLLAFSGSRTYHRMAVAIEDAGFEIRDMIEWIYGSGFPKSLNIAKQLDKDLVSVKGGVSTEKTDDADGLNGAKDQPGSWENNEYGGGNSKCNKCGKWFISGSPCVCPKPEITYKSDDANKFKGYGTALKPAHEPCVLARKPLDGTVANNVLKHGTGGLNIDGARIEATMGDYEHLGNSGIQDNTNEQIYSRFKNKNQVKPNTLGRFPANLIHDGSDEVEAVFPQTGASKATNRGLQHSGRHGGLADIGGNIKDGTDTVRGHNDNGGSASRFFYCAKASKSERNAGLEGFEEQITNDGRKTEIDNAFQRGITERKNHHPTVKPLSLTKYLATLIKPPTGGRLLVPFSGSGSEMIGALQAGWEYVEGVELTEEYIPIAEARIKYWLEKKEAENPQVALL